MDCSGNKDVCIFQEEMWTDGKNRYFNTLSNIRGYSPQTKSFSLHPVSQYHVDIAKNTPSTAITRETEFHLGLTFSDCYSTTERYLISFTNTDTLENNYQLYMK